MTPRTRMSQRSGVRIGRAGPKGADLRWGSRGGRLFRGGGPEDLRIIVAVFSLSSRFMMGSRCRNRASARYRRECRNTQLFGSLFRALRFLFPLAQDDGSALAPRLNPHRDVGGTAGL